MKSNVGGQYTAIFPSEGTDSQEAIISVEGRRDVFEHTGVKGILGNSRSESLTDMRRYSAGSSTGSCGET